MLFPTEDGSTTGVTNGDCEKPIVFAGGALTNGDCEKFVVVAGAVLKGDMDTFAIVLFGAVLKELWVPNAPEPPPKPALPFPNTALFCVPKIFCGAGDGAPRAF